MYGWLLLLHILGATVWTGGHLVLATTVLPQVLRERSPQRLLDFELRFERIGMPALIVQVITGVLLAQRLLPTFSHWLDFTNPVTHVVMSKLGLLTLTVLFALHAKWRVLPHLRQGSADKLVVMAWHIVPVTLFSVLFVVAGVSFRTGWFY